MMTYWLVAYRLSAITQMPMDVRVREGLEKAIRDQLVSDYTGKDGIHCDYGNAEDPSEGMYTRPLAEWRVLDRLQWKNKYQLRRNDRG